MSFNEDLEAVKKFSHLPPMRQTSSYRIDPRRIVRDGRMKVIVECSLRKGRDMRNVLRKCRELVHHTQTEVHPLPFRFQPNPHHRPAGTYRAGICHRCLTAILPTLTGLTPITLLEERAPPPRPPCQPILPIFSMTCLGKISSILRALPWIPSLCSNTWIRYRPLKRRVTAVGAAVQFQNIMLPLHTMRHTLVTTASSHMK
jgi:hypothetical protein